MPDVEAPLLEYEFSGVLFDMDCTLLDSHHGLKGAWEEEPPASLLPDWMF
ncbi:hypothetical protein BT69DRAFT_1327723 [Atractiella rhizophila]|nr:hypothetical protein BT69DRAFT_1327856 [Atractiella rhizophila]KAH8930597.1 hypothetical protein BT69DRAFT_1327723 [Atractiella rhizophila]